MNTLARQHGHPPSRAGLPDLWFSAILPRRGAVVGVGAVAVDRHVCHRQHDTKPVRSGRLATRCLFGFVIAAIAGFLLTAIPNWTGRRPVSGAPLALLAALWLVGRISCLISALLPPWLAISTDCVVPVASSGSGRARDRCRKQLAQPADDWLRWPFSP